VSLLTKFSRYKISTHKAQTSLRRSFQCSERRRVRSWSRGYAAKLLPIAKLSDPEMRITHNSPMRMLLDYLSADFNGGIPRATVTQLLSHVTNRALGEYLVELMRDEYTLRQIVKNSYVHQLGFEKYILLTDVTNNRFSLRLHYWQKDSVTPFEGEIHNHCHSFTSKVFLGSLIHTFYDIDPAGDSLSLFEYSIHPHTHVSKQRYIRNTGSVAISRSEVSSGQVYSLSSDILHSVKVGSDFAVSLLIQGQQETSAATVMKTYEKSSNKYEGVGIGKMAREQVSSRLSNIAERLGYTQ